MSRRGLAALVFVLGLVGALPAGAHWTSPGQVIAALQSPDARGAYAVARVERSESQPRLLVVSVGPGWSEIAPEQRRQAAERWRRHWRESVPSGVLALVDVDSARSLVSFDGAGRAWLRDADTGR